MGINGDEKDDSDGDNEDDDDDSSMCVWWVQERLSAPFTYMYSSTIYRGLRLLPCHSLPHLPSLLVHIIIIIIIIVIIVIIIIITRPKPAYCRQGLGWDPRARTSYGAKT